MKVNYYEVLGVDRSATEQVIRDRFRQLARENHPDRYRGPDKGEAVMYANVDTPKRDPSTGLYANLPKEIRDRLNGPGAYDENRLRELEG